MIVLYLRNYDVECCLLFLYELVEAASFVWPAITSMRARNTKLVICLISNWFVLKLKHSKKRSSSKFTDSDFFLTQYFILSSKRMEILALKSLVYNFK